MRGGGGGGGLCWQEIWHHSATQHKWVLFTLLQQQQQQQQSLRHLMTFLPKQGIIFCLSMTITLIWPQASFTRVFLIHHNPCEGTTILGPCLTCIKTHVLLLCLSLIHKHNSSTGVRGNIFFFSLQKDVTFGVCVVSMREQKSLARGIQPAGGFPRSAEERREGSLDTAGCAEAFIQLD